MRKNGNRWIALGTLGVMMFASLGPVNMAQAQIGTNGKRNLAIGLGAAGVYGLLTHRRTLAVVGLAGGAYAYYRYNKAHQADKRRKAAERAAWLRRQHRLAYYRHHHHYAHG